MINFNEKVVKTKQWDKFEEWYIKYCQKRNILFLILSTSSNAIEWFLSLPFEFQEGVLRSFLMDKYELIAIYTFRDYDIRNIKDHNNIIDGKMGYMGYARFDPDSKEFDTKLCKTHQEAGKEILMACFNK